MEWEVGIFQTKKFLHCYDGVDENRLEQKQFLEYAIILFRKFVSTVMQTLWFACQHLVSKYIKRIILLPVLTSYKLIIRD